MSQECSCRGGETGSIYLPKSATITKMSRMTEYETFFEVKLDSGESLGHNPGQFVEISIPGIGEAPISVSSSPDLKDAFQLVVRNTGRVTAWLTSMNEGDKIGVRGPFGNHFPVDSVLKGKDVLFICGGIGLVPVRSAIHYVLNRRADYGNVAILFGARTPADRLYTDELAEWEARDDVVFLESVDRSDETWKGNEGVITTLIPKIEIDTEETRAIVCGPPIMYKFVIMELEVRGLGADGIYISLERRMKCGVGKCGHCQINGLYTCIDGPVFNYADVAEAQEAI